MFFAIFAGLVGISAASESSDFVSPGRWMTDQDERFLFLPLVVEGEERSLDEILIFSNGQQLMVVANDEPKGPLHEFGDVDVGAFRQMITDMKKENLSDHEILERITEQADSGMVSHGFNKIMTKTKTGLKKILEKKREGRPPMAHTVTMGFLQTEAESTSQGWPHIFQVPFKLSDLRAKQSPLPKTKELSIPGVVNFGAHVLHEVAGFQTKASEKFAVQIPHPVKPDRVFVVKVGDKKLMAGMPFEKDSTDLALVGVPFQRVAICNEKGQMVQSDVTMTAQQQKDVNTVVSENLIE